jgi:arabinosyltransferase A/arabinosyltransferase B/arabinosyltransferase C
MPSHHPAQGRARRHRLTVLGLAVLSLLTSVAFVLAPVEQPAAVYAWPSAPGDASAVAIPLMLGRPTDLGATVDCAAARAAQPGTVLLSTTPLQPVRGEDVVEGLRVVVEEDGLRVRTGGTDLPTQQIPAVGDCAFALTSSASLTELTLDGDPLAEQPTDVRPWVAGVFTEADDADGMSVTVTADTVFQTSPTPLKTALAVIAVLALVGAVGMTARSERAAPAVDVVSPAHRPRRPVRWLVDASVVGMLAVWTVIGPLTVDDGYIAGIIRSRYENGYIGNVYRWFNAPEAPFGWFYEVMNAWSAISTSTIWLRIPSSLLGIATWLLIARGLLPRLGAFAASPWIYAVAAGTFALWWLPTNLGLRPEAWVAAGLAGVVVLVERGLARDRAVPVAVALVVAAATLAVTPTGAVAFLPFLAAAVPLLRLARRTTAGTAAVTALVLAASASALLLMFADQSLAAILRANEIRNELPGALPWSAEAERWYLLLSAGELQGSLSRRVPVLLTIAAVAGIMWRRRSARWPDDTVRQVADRLVATFALSLIVLLFTPTKWTMHFGAFVPVGTALVVLGVHLFGQALGRDSAAGASVPAGARGASLARTTTGLAVVLLVAALSWAGWNQWAYLSNHDVPWNDMPPQLLGISFSSVFLLMGIAVALGGAATVIWVRSRGTGGARDPRIRWLPSPGLVAVGLIALTVALELGSFAKSSLTRRDTYALSSDAVAAVSGRGCGLAEELRVETDPTAGLLAPASASKANGEEPRLDGFTEVAGGRTPAGPALSMGGAGLPGWAATGHTAPIGDGPATLVTPWFELPSTMETERLPLVVTSTGTRGKGTNLVAEFGSVDGAEVTAVGARGVPGGGGPAARDSRLDPASVPSGADVVRLVATDGGPDTDLPLAVSVPRVPVTTAFQEVVDPRSPAIVDWPVAFVVPCQELAVQRDGLTDVPRWRIASTSDAGDIIVAGFVGGPYTSARTLVDEIQVPVYLPSRPLERPLSLYEWEPRVPTEAPRRDVTIVTAPGWAG